MKKCNCSCNCDKNQTNWYANFLGKEQSGEVSVYQVELVDENDRDSIYKYISENKITPLEAVIDEHFSFRQITGEVKTGDPIRVVIVDLVWPVYATTIRYL